MAGVRPAIIWTNAGLLFIGPLGINFSDILIEIIIFSFKKMHLKTSSAKWRLCRFGLNELNHFSIFITFATMAPGQTQDTHNGW